MPTTVNGVGTHYYGKKNRSARTAPCHSCHRVANLESYDTRLWFVVIFIPIIPLGRKRIIDACPFCRRHFAANADTYEQSKQLQISGSLEEYRRAASPESALKAHGQLCRDIPALANSSLHVQTLLAMQKGKEVAADPSFEKNWEKPLISLALSLELSLEGQPEESARWRERAIKKFQRPRTRLES